MSRVLITGASGLVGRAVASVLDSSDHELILTDLQPYEGMPENAVFERLDVTGTDAEAVIGRIKPDVVIHLASIVTPSKGSTREFEYSVDVQGSENVLQACLTHSVRRLVVTSSGAAYGYHPRNKAFLLEDSPLEGNEAFAYAHHKRLVEERLEKARAEHPDLEQVVLRVGTVLDVGTDNQITALFRRPKLLTVSGATGGFVFIWAKDLAQVVARAAAAGPAGIYNVAGDGQVSMQALAKRMNKPLRTLPAWALKAALAVAKPLGLSRYGPEQVRFLQYRPMLDNRALKAGFGYTPELTSAEVFDLWCKGEGL
ncbi:NAD-dependent epimerase/dehydratase family protein [Lentibacter algarum]|uniref:NAD-dependent epimerase/dehydratase family protein n=1 Tax=Lentibacter algarum TaxID=576131 RepID=UPI001C06F83F|nr:NAD-dependent epimerase/dehydratase family protein [Lentibacter algarum]MBU2981827.1 NAD-dependent epimerase/dehydratase family protein [Lentibacter algarum]